jgi:hypothetical protein
LKKKLNYSDSTRHPSQDISPPISQIVLKNFIKISLIIKEFPEEILIKHCPEDFIVYSYI